MGITKNSNKQAIGNGLVEVEQPAWGWKYRFKSHIAICGREIGKLGGGE